MITRILAALYIPVQISINAGTYVLHHYLFYGLIGNQNVGNFAQEGNPRNIDQPLPVHVEDNDNINYLSDVDLLSCNTTESDFSRSFNNKPRYHHQFDEYNDHDGEIKKYQSESQPSQKNIDFLAKKHCTTIEETKQYQDYYLSTLTGYKIDPVESVKIFLGNNLEYANALMEIEEGMPENHLCDSQGMIYYYDALPQQQEAIITNQQFERLQKEDLSKAWVCQDPQDYL